MHDDRRNAPRGAPPSRRSRPSTPRSGDAGSRPTGPAPAGSPPPIAEDARPDVAGLADEARRLAARIGPDDGRALYVMGGAAALGAAARESRRLLLALADGVGRLERAAAADREAIFLALGRKWDVAHESAAQAVARMTGERDYWREQWEDEVRARAASEAATRAARAHLLAARAYHEAVDGDDGARQDRRSRARHVPDHEIAARESARCEAYDVLEEADHALDVALDALGVSGSQAPRPPEEETSHG